MQKKNARKLLKSVTPSGHSHIVPRSPNHTYYTDMSKTKRMDRSHSSNLFTTQSSNFSSTLYSTLSRSRTLKGMTQQSYSGLTNVRKGSTLVWDQETKQLKLYQHGTKSTPKIAKVDPDEEENSILLPNTDDLDILKASLEKAKQKLIPGICNSKGGKVMILMESGAVYQGGWTQNKQEGYGVCLYPDGRLYKGNWRGGLFSGRGLLKYPEGDVLEANFVGGMAQLGNQVRVTMRNGEQYSGEWRGEKRNGSGRYTYKNGDLYEGQWRNDKRSGKGTLTFKNGRVYRGEFLDDKPNGQGAYSIGNTVYETIA